MKTLLTTLTLGALILCTPSNATAGDCRDGRSSYSYRGGYYVQPQRYYPSYHHTPHYVDRHHSSESPNYDRHGLRKDSHGHRVDSHGHHKK